MSDDNSELPDEEILWECHSGVVMIVEDAGDYSSVMKRRDFARAVAPLYEALSHARVRNEALSKALTQIDACCANPQMVLDVVRSCRLVLSEIGGGK